MMLFSSPCHWFSEDHCSVNSVAAHKLRFFIQYLFM